MAQFKIRVELNKGKSGIPLGKLASISGGIHAFLSSFAGDVGLDSDPDNWVASNFKEGCLAYDIKYTKDITPEQNVECKRKLKVVVSANPTAIRNIGISSKTLSKTQEIVSSIDINEVVRFGVYDDEQEPKHWQELNKEKGKRIPDIVISDATSIEYYGGIQGQITSWFLKPSKPSDKPWFWLKDVSNDVQIKCIYSPAIHGKLSKATEVNNGIIHVYGLIKIEVYEDKIEYIEVDNIEPADDFTDADFDKFFGCAPNLTGGLTASEYVRRLRSNGEQAES